MPGTRRLGTACFPGFARTVNGALRTAHSGFRLPRRRVAPRQERVQRRAADRDRYPAEALPGGAGGVLGAARGSLARRAAGLRSRYAVPQAENAAVPTKTGPAPQAPIAAPTTGYDSGASPTIMSMTTEVTRPRYGGVRRVLQEAVVETPRRPGREPREPRARDPERPAQYETGPRHPPHHREERRAGRRTRAEGAHDPPVPRRAPAALGVEEQKADVERRAEPEFAQREREDQRPDERVPADAAQPAEQLGAQIAGFGASPGLRRRGTYPQREQQGQRAREDAPPPRRRPRALRRVRARVPRAAAPRPGSAASRASASR
ncbi:hypothetical protein GA0115246_108595 [Streptomyces sp. SolWspMP-sol7th]|nr:hypothetical protein GA0115246_108595 [Streptomyces sp. SolWspMP-sol7th]